MTNDEIELLLCPFCGGAVDLEQTIDKRKWWGVVCRNTIGHGGTCAIQQRPSASKEAAIARWNLRAERERAQAAEPVAWNHEDTDPHQKGWYAVMRADGSLCIRAWGNGNWWIPLADGWLSDLPPGFKWFGPIAPIEWDTPRTKAKPMTARMERAAFLCDGARFKLSFSEDGNVSVLSNYRTLLDGRWVALVAAENDCHLKPTHPARPAVTEEMPVCPRHEFTFKATADSAKASEAVPDKQAEVVLIDSDRRIATLVNRLSEVVDQSRDQGVTAAAMIGSLDIVKAEILHELIGGGHGD